MRSRVAVLVLLVPTAAAGCSGDPAPRPDPAADLADLLRTRATATGPAHCAPRDVEVALRGYDVATGHRYTWIVVRNRTDDTCVVEGYPGLGVRGTGGAGFDTAAERRPAPPDEEAPVSLAPGEAAAGMLEWTGELPGAGAERASLLVVQLASGQQPVAVPARLEDEPDDTEPLDIGPLTTLRVGPFGPLDAELSGSRLEPARPEK